MRWLALSVFLAACGSSSTTNPSSGTESTTPPPYVHAALSDEEHAEVCGHPSEPASGDPCATDSDCRICHDGSACGVPVDLTTLTRRGAACRLPDAAECEYAAVRCCDGRCRVVSH